MPNKTRIGRNQSPSPDYPLGVQREPGDTGLVPGEDRQDPTRVAVKADRRAALGGVDGEALRRRDRADRDGTVPRGRPHFGADLKVESGR